MKKRVKTPTVIQMEAVECGAAALGIILGYYNRIVPLTELRQECGVSRDGSTASNILRAAKNYGLEAKGYKKGLEALKTLPPPYIVFWNFNHFLVVEKFSKNRVYLNDPATGPRWVDFEEFNGSYTGVVLTFKPGPEFKTGGRKPSIFLSLYDRLKGSKAAIFYVILAGFFLVIPGLAIPVFSQIFVDNILVNNQTNWLRPLLLGMAITTILRGLLTALQLTYLRKLYLKLSISMSAGFLWHLLQLPVGFFAQRFAGDISDRLSINSKVAEVLSGQLATTVIDTILVVFYALIMFAYDWILTLIGICFSLINVLALQFVSRRRVDANMKLLQDRAKVAGVSIEALQNIENLKASALESDFFARWSGYYTKEINALQRLAETNQILGILPTLLTSLTTALILIIGGLRVMDGYLSMGMLVAFQSLMQSFQRPVNTLVSFGRVIQELEGDLNRLDDVLNNKVEKQEQAPSSFRFSLKGNLELWALTFGYSRVAPPLIENFNCIVKPGERIAIIGGSGSGKSTIAKLIAGLYLPWKGEILFDGIPREKIPRSVLTNFVSMVEQDIFIFAGSVRENLTLWDESIPEEQMIKAAKDAEIHETIMMIPGGYDGQLLEGGMNLSGGQRQRLEIARALVNNPAILIMDEATSALDAELEMAIDRNLRRRGCSCVIIAHRLSTIRDCDEIIVLEEGKIVQRGTHEEMWRVDGVYSRLISVDFLQK